MVIFLFIVVLVLVGWMISLQIHHNQLSDSVDIELAEYVKSLAENQVEVRNVKSLVDTRGAVIQSLVDGANTQGTKLAALEERVEVLEKTPAQFESKYSDSTKQTCIEYFLSNKENLSLRQAARDMGVPYSTLKGWVKKAL